MTGCRATPRSAAARRRRAPLLALLGSAAWLCAAGSEGAPAAAPAALDLETLMGYFAKSRGVAAEFREEKSLPLLSAPLVSEGVLYFAPPDRMARFTSSPEKSSLIVVGDRLRIEDGLGVEEIDLGAQRTAKQFVDQLLVLFRGDLAGLRRDYEVGFEGDTRAWSLRLVSKSVRVRQLIREVMLRGRADHLDEMVVSGSGGEVTRTTYQRVATDRPFRAEELAVLFPAQGSPAPLAGGVGTP